jgi:hypothetical protein
MFAEFAPTIARSPDVSTGRAIALRTVAVGLCAFAVAGCSLTSTAAGMAGSMADESMPHMRGFWDYEIAGQANAGGIVQLESMHSIRPGDERLSMLLCASYVGYAFGWLEVAAERAEKAGDYAAATRDYRRIELLYRRARDLALGVMRARDDGIDAALKGNPVQLAAYLDEHYGDREDDVAPLFWLGSSWGAMLGASEDFAGAIDLPTIVTIVEHVVKLDDGYEGAGALLFLGGFNAQYPAQFGGSPEKGKQYFERALEVTGRRAHQVQLNYARTYAVTVRDKALFKSLLMEIIESRDQGNEFRMANKIARIRAELLLSNADTLF